ncbi:hypothetical protein VE04_05755 [Pseudogymnoascus sp. 24MN13]|nr:hypothetical protein VE04_05755 [Pseudogymnoascus sp. 24MN13]
MTIVNRSRLISKIKDNKDSTDMNHTTVQSLAIQHHIPKSVADLPPLQHTEVKIMADPQYSEQTSESAIRHPGDAYEVTASTAPPAPEPGTGLIGDIYELTPEDALAVISDISGPIWLTDPYDGNTQPFVNISISWKLLDHFILQRRRIM